MSALPADITRTSRHVRWGKRKFSTLAASADQLRPPCYRPLRRSAAGFVRYRLDDLIKLPLFLLPPGCEAATLEDGVGDHYFLEAREVR
jgi:hypothetical protein